MSIDFQGLIIGAVDCPATFSKPFAGKQLIVSGWAINGSGIDRIEIYCDECATPRPVLHLSRPDVATEFPEVAGAGRSGFFGSIDVSKLKPGQHSLRVCATACNGARHHWNTQFLLASEEERYRQWNIINTHPIGSPQSQLRFPSFPQEGPNFSIIIRTSSRTSVTDIERTISSLNAQSYKPFETQVCDDIVYHAVTRNISGDYVCMIDAGDILTGNALQLISWNLIRNPEIDLIYFDHDSPTGPDEQHPFLKPSWSPNLLADYNYIGRSWFAKRRLMRKCLPDGGKLSRHELLLDIGRKSRCIGHVPTILMSQAQRPRGEDFKGPPTTVIRATKATKVSIVVPTCLSHPDVARQCLDGIFGGTNYPEIEVVVMVNNVDSSVAKEFLSAWPVRICYWPHAFNWSAINNKAAFVTNSDYLLFMNDDVVPIRNDWLENLVAVISNDSKVGAVGALLRYPSGQIQHAGVWIATAPKFLARHSFRFCSGDESTLKPIIESDREQSAVTGACLLTTRNAFMEVGGFDERLSLIYNDIDYCLRLGALGWRSVVSGKTRMTHHEGISREGMDESADSRTFSKRWEDHFPSTDPFSHPNLQQTRDDWVLDLESVPSIEARLTYIN